MNGEDGSRCRGVKTDGSQCQHTELPGLGYCLAHAPDELIPQAELISGRKRCTGRARATLEDGSPSPHTGQRCGSPVIPGGTVCSRHGGKLPMVKRAAFENVLNKTAQQELAEVVALERRTDKVMRSSPFATVTNPFEELMLIAGEMKAFKDRIGAKVDSLEVEAWRYEHERAGEQLRAEILVYVGAMERLSVMLTRIAKLGIEERMMRITERQAEIIEQAFARTLADPEFDLPAATQKSMRAKVVERLRVA